MYNNVILVKGIILCISVLLGVVFSGCGEPIPSKIIYTPNLNEVATAEVGQNMYSKINAVFEYDFQVHFKDESMNIKYAKDRLGYMYFFKKQENGVCTLINGSRGFIYLIDKKCNGVFTLDDDGDKLSKPLKYKIVSAKPTDIIENSFKYTVTYQGKIGNKLNISFKEFTSTPMNGRHSFIIKDAYTQNIEYELDENGEAMIGFKGLRIKVLKATNFDIAYKVLHDYKF